MTFAGAECCMTCGRPFPGYSVLAGENAAILLPLIEAFLTRSGMAAATLGLLAANDPRLVSDLRRGAGVRNKRFNRVRAFIAGYELPLEDAAR